MYRMYVHSHNNKTTTTATTPIAMMTTVALLWQRLGYRARIYLPPSYKPTTTTITTTTTCNGYYHCVCNVPPPLPHDTTNKNLIVSVFIAVGVLLAGHRLTLAADVVVSVGLVLVPFVLGVVDGLLLCSYFHWCCRCCWSARHHTIQTGQPPPTTQFTQPQQINKTPKEDSRNRHC